jgi:hypothetical protein
MDAHSCMQHRVLECASLPDSHNRHSPPIMRHQYGLLIPQGPDHSRKIRRKLLNHIVRDPRGLVGIAVSAHVDCHAVVAIPKVLQLVVPGVPSGQQAILRYSSE